MCGIAGIIAKKHLEEERFDKFIAASKLMNHRGPDYTDMLRFDNLLLIHYRLSIIDLDPRSNQPFQSHSGENVCIYNGEIYNYAELKLKYKLKTKTTSDTEVMIESYEKFDKEIVKEWNGIFSIGIFNKFDKKLTLIRDRFGVKPLYYYEDDHVILFASEAKVIFDWLPELKINYEGLAQYLWYGNTISEHTIIKGVRKLNPAAILEIDLKTFEKKLSKFWQLPKTKTVNDKTPLVIQNIKQLLVASVERQLISDVPIGILLSGGIDSSAIVGFASQVSEKKIDTYSVDYDFNIGGKSELEQAALVAKKYKTNHHELTITSKNIPEIFNSLVFQYDEPFADTASIPLFQLSQACSTSKTVILQGDGGDEVFAGYRRYNITDWLKFWQIATKVSYPFIINKRWKERIKRMSFVVNQKDNGLRMAYFLTQDVPYKNPYNIISKEFQNKLNNFNPFQPYQDFNVKYKDEDLVQRLLFADINILLPHTYLEKVDKATMLTSVESRVPFLDNDLTEYIFSLPSAMKVKYGSKKYLLKKALKEVVPDEILNAPKRGFDVPYKMWLKKDLYDFAITKFDENDFKSLFNTSILKKLLNEHRMGIADHGPLLWKSLILISWLEIYKEKIVL